jgi:KaiC/GvpD/RAD55 family RecA-like ATPase
MLNFGWNFTEMEDQGKIVFIDLSPIIHLSPEEFHRTVFTLKVPEFTVDTISASVQKFVDKVRGKRIVIDGINSLSLHDMEPTKKRRDISNLFQGLKKTQCTCLFTSEIRASTLEREFQVEEYLADGVIILQKIIKDNKMGRIIFIDKIRGIDHDTQARPYSINHNGIAIYAKESILLR